MTTLPIPAEILAAAIRQAFGSQAGMTGCQVLTGGARKQVFRLQLSGSLPDVALLAWKNDQDYFGERDNPESTRSDSQAPLLYQANTQILVQNGLRVPLLYHFDTSCQQVPFAFALVEFVQAVSYNEWRVNRSPQECTAVLVKAATFLQQMHTLRRDYYGTLLDCSPESTPCYEKDLQEARLNLHALAQSFAKVAVGETRVNRKLDDLASQIRPRHQYCFIHDELGPDEHLLIQPGGEIVIIDLDGCHYYDVEREFSYLKIRFGSDYEILKRDGLDEARMAFYTLCIHISAAYGHYRLYQKGFPDPEMLRAIYELNIQKLLGIASKG